MAKKTEKQNNSIIDNSKFFCVKGSITHSLYLVSDPKTGKVKQECRTERKTTK